MHTKSRNLLRSSLFFASYIKRADTTTQIFTTEYCKRQIVKIPTEKKV